MAFRACGRLIMMIAIRSPCLTSTSSAMGSSLAAPGIPKGSYRPLAFTTAGHCVPQLAFQDLSGRVAGEVFQEHECGGQLVPREAGRRPGTELLEIQ
jgi:hypothetical protein